MVKKGDTQPLEYTIEKYVVEKGGVIPVDISGCLVSFSMIRDGNLTWDIDQASCTVVTATQGLVEYPWDADETATTGMFRAKFSVVDQDDKVWSFPDYGVQWIYIYDDATM